MKMIALFHYQNGLLRNKSLLERMKTETIDYKQKIQFSFIKAFPFVVENKLEESGEKK
jgi:carboxyl-terminal processing protease